MSFIRIIIVVSLFCLLTASVSTAADQRSLSVRPKAPTGEEVKGDLWLVTIGINSCNVEVSYRRVLGSTDRNNNLGFRLAAPVD